MKNISILILLFVFSTINLHAQIYVNVNAQGSNDGTSWSNAYVMLNDAIANSAEDDELWIASGTYLPGGTAASKDSSFTLPHNLKLYGGFDGTEANLTDRDFESNITILSGDINGDDVINDLSANRTDNCIHVMSFNDNLTIATVIDGITISHGNTVNFSGSGDERRGGGILTYSPITLQNCSFTQNWGFFGAGFYPRTTDNVIVKNCNFSNNSASTTGGGILILGSCEIEDCTFIDNEGDGSGQGIGFVLNSNMSNIKIKRCEFTGHFSAFNNGVAIEIRNEGPLDLEMEDCNFSDNSTIVRGAALDIISTGGSGDLVFNRCTFNGNTAGVIGGMLNSTLNNETSMTFNNCYIDSNTSTINAGAMNINGGITNLVSNIISSNGVDSIEGGAIYYIANDSSELNLMNVTFANNISSSGSDIFVASSNAVGASISSQNTIYASDLNGSFNSESSNVTVTSTGGNIVIDNSLSGNFTMSNDLNTTSPGFVDITVGNYNLDTGSPAIDNGTADNAPVKDIEGNLRQGNVDSGALEFIDLGSNTNTLDPASISFSLTPNPTSEILNYSFDHEWKGQVNIKIISLLGQTVAEKSFNKLVQSYNGSINISDLQEGHYYLLLELGNTSSSVLNFIKL